MTEELHPIDHGAIKASQIVVIALNTIAFILNAPWLVAFIAAVNLIGAALGVPGFVLVYKYILKPLGWVKPEVLRDNSEPHRFAQGFAGVVLSAGAISLFAGLSALGWGLVWLVTCLAALNAFGGFCAGCFVYYWLTRFGVPGFSKVPPTGTFPGLKPRGS